MRRRLGLGSVFALALFAAIPRQDIQAQDTQAQGTESAAVSIETRSLPGLRAEVATWLLRGEAAGNLESAFRIAPGPARSVEVTVESAIEALSRQDPGGISLELYVYAVTGAQRVVAFLTEEVVASEGELSGVRGLRYYARLEIPESAVELDGLSIRALVYEPSTTRFAVASRAITLDEPKDDLLLRLPSRGRWLLASSAAEPANLPARPVVEAAGFEIAVGGLEATGAAEVVVELESLAPAEPVSGAPAAVAPEPTRLVATAVGAAGERFEAAVGEVVSGPYRIRARSGQRVSGAETVVVIDADVAEAVRQEAGEPNAPLAWPDLLRFERELADEAAALGLAESAQVAPARRLQRAYAEALRSLSEHFDVSRTVTAMLESERQAIEASVNPLGLPAVELRVIEPVVERSPAVALALLAVHSSAYEVARAADDFGGAARHRRVVVDLARRAASQAIDQQLRGEIADSLAALAIVVDDHGFLPGAEELLQTAVEVDRDHATGYALLARTLEVQGRYDEAIEAAERASSLDAGDELVRLRQAVLLTKVGRAARAEEIFRSLLGARRPMVRTLSYQELARLLMGSGRVADVVPLLEEGIAHTGSDAELFVLLAAAFDRTGRPAASAALLAEALSSGTQASARLRYGEVPAWLRERLGSRVDRAARLRFARLFEVEM